MACWAGAERPCLHTCSAGRVLRTTERVAIQNRQNRHKQMQVQSSDDGHARRGRVPRTRPVATAQGGMEGVEKGPRGSAVSKKEAEEEWDLLGVFFYRIYEFLFSFSNPAPVIHNPSVPAGYVRHQICQTIFCYFCYFSSSQY